MTSTESLLFVYTPPLTFELVSTANVLTQPTFGIAVFYILYTCSVSLQVKQLLRKLI